MADGPGQRSTGRGPAESRNGEVPDFFRLVLRCFKPWPWHSGWCPLLWTFSAILKAYQEQYCTCFWRQESQKINGLPSKCVDDLSKWNYDVDLGHWNNHGSKRCQGEDWEGWLISSGISRIVRNSSGFRIGAVSARWPWRTNRPKVSSAAPHGPPSKPLNQTGAVASVGVEWGEGMATLVISVLFPLTTFWLLRFQDFDEFSKI